MSELSVVMCDPRDRESEIRDIFARNGKPAFDKIFETAYRPRAEQGMRSWLGIADGRAVMHISVTPLNFVGGDRAMTGGVLSDLMVDEDFRDFWGPVRMLRTMVSDLKRAGQIGFLITTSTDEAESIFKAGGFKPFGMLRRYVMPLYLPYLGMARLRARVKRPRAKASAFQASMYDSMAGSANCAGRWRPRAELEYYATRIPRSDYLDGTWIDVTRKRTDATGSALVSRTQLPEMQLADAFWNDHDVGLGEVVHAAARYARSQRFNKLTITTLQESHVAQQLERFGFFARDIRSTLLVNRIGGQTTPPVEEWFLPGFALSSW